MTLTFDLMTPKYIGFFPLHRGIMWPSLVEIRYTELKLLCGNLCGRPPAIPNHIIRPVSRRAHKNQAYFVNHGSKVSILKEKMVNISLNVVLKMFER